MAKKKPKSDEAPSFEEALEELEAIVRRLEQGGGALDEALTDYAKAIELMKTCHNKLETVERRIEVLSGVDVDGNPIAKPLEDRDETLEEKRSRRGSRRSAGQSDGSELF